MFTTKDYLSVDPWEAVIGRINDSYNIELEPFTTKLGSIESLGGTRTKVVIVPNQSTNTLNTAPPIERTEYIYDRLDLTSFFRTPTPKDLGGFTLPTSTFKILDAISELNNIKFSLNDFVHVQFDSYGEVYTLTANPKSLRFVGSINFRLINTTRRLLSTLGNKLEFPTANDFALGADGTKITGQYTVSAFDFTEDRDFLKVISKDSVWPSGKKLAALMENLTGTPWVCDTEEAEWNIAYDVKNGEARFNVVYNGMVLPRYTPRTDIQRVLVLQLSELSTNVDGYLLIHYN